MKKTIKQDQERLVLESELLNDNSLLEVVAGEGFVDVTIRYVDYAKRSIQEQNLIHMNIVEYMKHTGELIQMNEAKTSIAVFAPTEGGYTLQSVYDTESHEFGSVEFVDLEYQKKFPDQPLQKRFFKEKKTVVREG